jgi:hypothetical protein
MKHTYQKYKNSNENKMAQRAEQQTRRHPTLLKYILITHHARNKDIPTYHQLKYSLDRQGQSRPCTTQYVCISTTSAASTTQPANAAKHRK